MPHIFCRLNFYRFLLAYINKNIYLCAAVSVEARVAKWQTRWFQVPVE